MREPDDAKRVRLIDWRDPDTSWQNAWSHRRQALLAGIVVTAAAAVLAALDPLVPLPLTPVGVACLIVGVLTPVGVLVSRVVRWRLRDTWFMSASWRTHWGPLLFVGLLVLVVVFSLVALIARVATGDSSLDAQIAVIGVLDDLRR